MVVKTKRAGLSAPRSGFLRGPSGQKLHVALVLVLAFLRLPILGGILAAGFLLALLPVERGPRPVNKARCGKMLQAYFAYLARAMLRSETATRLKRPLSIP